MNAHYVLDNLLAHLGGDPAEIPQSVNRLADTIKLATNEDVILNEQQETLLRTLVFEPCAKESLFIHAVTIATWINSCK